MRIKVNEVIVEQKKQIIELIEDKIGHEISYESISPTILHAFEIRGLSISSAAESPDSRKKQLLYIGKLRLQFNLFKLQKNNPLNAFAGLLIVDSDFIYDDTAAGELSQLLKAFTSAEPSAGKSRNGVGLPDDFTIRGKNIGLKLSAEQFDAELYRVFFSLTTSAEDDLTLALKADAGGTLFMLPEALPLKKLSIKTDIKISGRIDSDLQWSNLDMVLKKFDSDILSISRIKWNLKYNSPGRITLTKTGDNIPADLSLDADLENGLYELDLQAQDFVFSDYFESSGFLSSYGFITDSALSGWASAVLNAEETAVEYSGDLAVGGIGGILENPFNLSAAFSGLNREINISESTFTGEPGKASFSGTVVLDQLPAVNGTLSVPGLMYSGISIASRFNIKTDQSGKYLLSSRSAEINGIKLSDFSADFLPYENNIEFSIYTDVINPGNQPEPVFSEGIIQFGDEYYIQAELSTEKLLLAPIINALPADFEVPAVLSGFELSTEIYLSGTPDQLAFASPSVSISDRENPDRALFFAFSGNNAGIRINNINLVWDANNLQGRISSDLTETRDLVLNTSLLYNGTALSLAGVFDNSGNLSLSGEYSLKLNLFNLPGGGRSLLLSTERLPLRTSEETVSFISINASGLFQSADNWKLLVNRLAVEDIPTGFGNGRVELAALLSEEGGSIYKIHYADKKSELNGGGSLLLSRITPFPEGRLQLNLSSSAETEEYSLVLGFSRDALDGDLAFSGLPLSRLAENFPLSGDVYGRLSIAGDAGSPQLRLLLNTGNTFFNNEKLNLETALYYENLKLHVERITASYGMYRFEEVDGLLDLENGTHRLAGEILSESSLLNFSGTLSASAVTPASGSISALPSVLSEDFTAKIKINDISLNLEKKNPWEFDIVKRGEMLNLIGGTEGEINGSMFEDGHFILIAEKPFPIGISASGTLKDGQITANLKDISYNFDDLTLGSFALYSGEVTGQLRIQGQANDPDFYGQLDFNDIELQVPVVLDITKPFDTSFFFSGKEITAPATRAYTETGLIYVNAEASMERWLPSGYDLDIKIPEGNPVAARYYKNSIFLSGYTTGELDIFGDLTRLNIEGNINATEAVFMLNDDLDYPKNKKSKITIISKLKCTLGENNQFFWPSQDLPIVKSFLGGKSELDLTYEPDSGIVLNGDLKLDGGEIFYFQKNFYIKEGELKFINVQKGDINPLLSVRAEIRDINTEGEMSRIYLIVDQSPLSSFVPRFESDPAMSTAEIMALLGGNIFDSFESASGASSIESATLLVTDIFTQFALLKSVEDNLKSTLGLDLLSIRSSFLSNFIENTLFTPSSEVSGDNFVNYLDNTTLFLGKYFTDDIFLQGMFQFDLYGDKGYSEDPELNFDSEITLEWEGPVANVELSFYPDFRDPIAGLNKTSVGLSWRFSY